MTRRITGTTAYSRYEGQGTKYKGQNTKFLLEEKDVEKTIKRINPDLICGNLRPTFIPYFDIRICLFGDPVPLWYTIKLIQLSLLGGFYASLF